MKGVESLSLNGLRYSFTDDRAQRITLFDLSASPALPIPLQGNRGDALGLSFDPDGDFLACATKSEIIVWLTKNRTREQEIPLPPGYTTTRLAVSPKGRYIAAIDSLGKTRLWDTNSSDHTGIPIPFADAKSVSFNPNGKWLSIGNQSKIRLWNLHENNFDRGRISTEGFSVKFSSDNSRLVVQTGQNAMVSVWDARDFLLEGTEGIVGQSSDFAFTSPETSSLAVSNETEEEGVFVERFDASWALMHVCDIVHRNLNQAELNQYLSGFDYVSPCRL